MPKTKWHYAITEKGMQQLTWGHGWRLGSGQTQILDALKGYKKFGLTIQRLAVKTLNHENIKDYQEMVSNLRKLMQKRYIKRVY